MNAELTVKPQPKAKRFFKKLGTKNLIVICAVLLIGAAIGVNYLLYQPSLAGKDALVDIDLSNEDLTKTLEGDQNAQNYFAQTTLSRKQARDEALEVLQTVAKSDTALPESVQSALTDISQIAKDIENESNIETLVKAKGFEDCIAVISDNSATVIVKTDGLLQSQISQINEIVYEQSGITPVNLKIIERK